MLFARMDVAELIGLLVALVVGITFHEFMHAYVADQLGDHRPRAMGRVSLNPTDHIDPIGAIFFLVAGFGWGKPVQVNPYALRPGRFGMAYVAAAGPLANLVVASIAAVAFRGVALAGAADGPSDFVWQLLFAIVQFNVILALFNLLPIPPLDGYNLVLPFLPRQRRPPGPALRAVRGDDPAAAGVPAAAGRRRGEPAGLDVRRGRHHHPAADRSLGLGCDASG